VSIAAENTESYPRERKIHAAYHGQIDTAPVHHRALAEERNKRRNPDKDNNAARNRNERTTAPAVWDEIPTEAHCQCEHDTCRNCRGLKCRQPKDADPHAVEPRTDEAAQAPECVHAAHDAPPDPLLYDDRRNIDDDIKTAHQCSKYEDHGYGGPERIHQRDRKQSTGEQDSCRHKHAAAAEPRRECTRERHRRERTDADAQQQEPEHIVSNRKPLAQHGDERSPRCRTKSTDKEKCACRVCLASSDHPLAPAVVHHIPLLHRCAIPTARKTSAILS